MVGYKLTRGYQGMLPSNKDLKEIYELTFKKIKDLNLDKSITHKFKVVINNDRLLCIVTIDKTDKYLKVINLKDKKEILSFEDYDYLPTDLESKEIENLLEEINKQYRTNNKKYRTPIRIGKLMENNSNTNNDKEEVKQINLGNSNSKSFGKTTFLDEIDTSGDGPSPALLVKGILVLMLMILTFSIGTNVQKIRNNHTLNTNIKFYLWGIVSDSVIQPKEIDAKTQVYIDKYGDNKKILNSKEMIGKISEDKLVKLDTSKLEELLKSNMDSKLKIEFVLALGVISESKYNVEDLENINQKIHTIEVLESVLENL